MMQEEEKILKSHGLRSTVFRAQVLSIFNEKPSQALPQDFIESALGEFDRITLYRTLKRFEEVGIIHKAINVDEEVRYALCSDDCSTHDHNDEHPHFLCEMCGQTYCLDTLGMPEFEIPGGYKLNEIMLSLSGICPQCNKDQSL